MQRFDPAHIRNVALVGHSGSGKTTLSEALLFRAGVINRLGRVEDGTTVCDTAAEEKERGLSLSLAVAPFSWPDPVTGETFKINLIDTPGYADFVGDVHAALRVADLAVFVVSAVEGVEVQTEAIWRLAEKAGLPRMVFVNKLDRERASFDRTLEQLRDRFGAGIAPLELPIGEESAFHGIADLLTDTAYLYDSGHGEQAPIPDEMEAREHEVHDNLVEGIVVADDDQLERYLEGDVPSFTELEHTLAHGIASAQVFPVVCGAALTPNGPVAVDRLANYICEIAPSPVDRPTTVTAGDTQVEIKAEAGADPLAFVFKSIADPFVGRISLFKVLSGTVENDANLRNTRSGRNERLHGLLSIRGDQTESVDRVVAGDLGAVAKLDDTRAGDCLAPENQPVTAAPIERPDPVLATAIVARSQQDEDKLATALHKLHEEDPVLVVERDDETHQTVLRGAGETHLNITIERLARAHGVAVDTEPVRVKYRETITKPAEAEGKHKKQSGGHGQFAIANIKVRPLERGEGFRFENSIVGGAISKGYVPAVEKGVAEAMSSGGYFGHPVVDVAVELVDGKEHSVDSSEMAFKVAGRLAFRAALAQGSPVLLEPISRVTVVAPTELQGDVMGDLNSRRGRIAETQTLGDDEQMIVAMVPEAEIGRYEIELRSLTSGRGRFSATHDHYEILPAHLVDSVRRELEEEEESTV